MRVYKVGPSACTHTHSGRSTWGVTYVGCSSDISFVGDEKLTNICFLVEGTSQKRCVSFLQRTDTVSTIQPSQDPHTVQPSPDPPPSNLHQTSHHPTFTRPHTIQPSQDPPPSNLHQTSHHPTFTRPHTIQPSQDPHTIQPSQDPTPFNLHKIPHTIQPSQDPHTIHNYNHVLISPHSLPPGPNHTSPSSPSAT